MNFMLSHACQTDSSSSWSVCGLGVHDDSPKNHQNTLNTTFSFILAIMGNTCNTEHSTQDITSPGKPSQLQSAVRNPSVSAADTTAATVTTEDTQPEQLETELHPKTKQPLQLFTIKWEATNWQINRVVWIEWILTPVNWIELNWTWKGHRGIWQWRLLLYVHEWIRIRRDQVLG